MSATAEQSYEFNSGNNTMLLDLNLSLQHYSTAAAATTTPPPATDRRVVVDLTTIKSISISNSTAGGSQSQNSTLSCTKKRTQQHHQHQDEKEPSLLILPSSSSPAAGRDGGGGGGGSDEDELDGENSRKKLRLSRDQSLLLEDTFKHHNTLNPRQKQALAKQLGLSARQVEVWFQNRRARTKLKQTEAECEYMKRNCETLMDHVRRLQKEVNELRSLKLAPQIYMQMPTATTLTLCPSCERVGSVSGNLWTGSKPKKPHF